MNKNRGLVSRVIRFSAVDGPGNRLVLFLQGCNFRCINCHNPHTIGTCTLCGECVKVCPAGALHLSGARGPSPQLIHTEALCRNCERCLSICPVNSNPRARWFSVEEVLEIIRPVSPFLSGITVSGGESTLQLAFLVQLFTALRSTPDLQQLTIFVDSNGSLDIAGWEALLPVTDGVMLDLKAFDSQTHHKLTGLENETVLRSLEFLSSQDKLYEVRLLIIPGYNDGLAQLRNTASYLAEVCPTTRIKLIPFRRHGVLPRYSHLAEPDSALMKSIEAIFREQGFSSILIPQTASI